MRRRTQIIGAVMSAVLFGSLCVGSTLALYNSQKKVNNHLRSGNFHAMLYLTSLSQDELDNKGEIFTNNVDLTTYDAYDDEMEGVNIGEDGYSGRIFNYNKIVPTMEGSATFKIHNAGEVAFTFTIEMIDFVSIKYDADQDKYVENEEAEIRDQLTITPTGFEPETPKVAPGNDYEFGISFVFEDKGDDNNKAMDQTVEFDIQVTCTQVVKA